MNFWQRFLYRHSAELVCSIADCLIAEPAGWTNNRGYWLHHEGIKVDIWIANRDYALRLQVWPIKPGFPAEIRLPWIERQLLWSLVKARREMSPRHFERAAAAEVLRQRREAA